MAVNVRPGPAPEIIELIDDDLEPGSGVWSTHATVPPPERRWIGPIGAAAILIAIGYGVISSAIASNNAKSQPPPTSPPRTTAVSSTISPQSAVTLVSPQFYVADPVPAGFSMHFAETLGMGGNTADFTDSTTAQLWATDGATANSGAWFVVSRGTHHSTGRNSYRTVADGINVVVEHDPASGQSRLSFGKDGDGMEITAFGWTDRQLLRLVDSVYIADSTIRFHDPFFVTDHKPLLYSDPPTALYGVPVAWVGYTTAVPAALANTFTITVAGYPQSNHDVAVRFSIVDESPVAVGDLSGIIGKSAADPRLVILQWRDEDRLITMRGNVDQQLLVSIAQTVRPGADASVRADVDANPPAVAAPPIGDPHTVASGWLDGPWLVQVSAATGDNATSWFVWWIGQPGGTGIPSQKEFDSAGPGPTIETLVEHGRTYVLAKVPRGMAGAKLHVNRTDLPSVEIDMIDVDAGLADEFAAYAFTEPVPFTAEIIDSSGGPVATWPTT